MWNQFFSNSSILQRIGVYYTRTSAARTEYRSSTGVLVHGCFAMCDVRSQIIISRSRKISVLHCIFYYRASGMPNSIETYGVISALWTSSVALGSFIGPTMSGVLYDTYGFAKGSLSLVIIMVIMVSKCVVIWYSTPIKWSWRAIKISR